MWAVDIPARGVQAASSASVLWRGSREEEGAERLSAPTAGRTLAFAAPWWQPWEAQWAEEAAGVCVFFFRPIQERRWGKASHRIPAFRLCHLGQGQALWASLVHFVGLLGKSPR